MSLSQLTVDNVKTLKEMYNHGDRTGMYLQYYTWTGNKQALDQAYISSFSGYKGAIAECANEIVASAHPDFYPKVGVIGFSNEIGGYLLNKIEQDVLQGGSGLFSEEQIYQFAKQVWTKYKIENLFPGNILRPQSVFTEGAYASYLCMSGQESRVLRPNPLDQETTLKRYGKSRQQFTDLNKYHWVHIKPHGVDLSLAINRSTGITDYVENSKFAALDPSTQSARIGAASGILGGLDLSRLSSPLSRQGKARPTLPRKKVEKSPAAQFLRGFGLNVSDISPKDYQKITALSTTYNAQRSQFANRFPFEFFSEAFSTIGQLAHASGNPKLLHVAQVGSSAVNLLKQVSTLP
ncbi:MAG: hypothetical protein LLG04_02805, partial [Parachlamydia sp.]|nr:hypothetical protein [Parachlamydia sp.]